MLTDILKGKTRGMVVGLLSYVSSNFKIVFDCQIKYQHSSKLVHRNVSI